MKIDDIKYQNLFKVFEILLQNQIINTKLIINWADEIIASNTEFEYVIIELSTESQDINKAISILSANSQNANIEIVSRAVIGILSNFLKVKKVEIDKVSIVINDIAYYDGLTENENVFLYGFGDFYDLAVRKIYGNLETITKEIFEFVSIYNNFNIENYESWNQINEQIKISLPENLKLLKDKYYS